MAEYYHQTDETRRAIDKIRKFCKTPALNGGGMLLVTGERGVGKTRLVDEALNDRRQKILRWSEFREQVAKYRRSGTGGVGSRRPTFVEVLRYTGQLLGQQLKARGGRLVAIAAGHDPDRCRLRIKRRPRGVSRILLPVPVDPFFPDGGGAAASTGTAQSAGPDHADLDGDTLALLRNLVFALTSAIDPRHGVRRHGRTLKARLGPITYWFTRTALLKPQGRPRRDLTIVLWLLLAFLGGVLFSLGLQTPSLAPWTDPGYVGAVAWRSFLLAFPATLAAWLWLRYLDLARLRRMSAHLYDLIHAQQFSMEMRASLERTWRWEAKGQRLLQVLAVIALASGVLLANPALWQRIVTQSQTVLIATGDGAGTMSNGSKSSTGDTVPFKPTAGVPVKYPLDPLGAAIALAGLAALGLTGGSSTRRHASFGAGNRVWLISLLRRYLYLLHRAGIEPVVVIDEIDKLTVSPEALRKEAAQATAPPPTAEPPPARPAEQDGGLRSTATSQRHDQKAGDQPPTTVTGSSPGLSPLDCLVERIIERMASSPPPAKDQPPAPSRDQLPVPTRLDRFVATLVRLKQSLGAEVIWILIDSDELYARVIVDRDRPLGAGPLATLIQCEVSLNPISFRDFKAFCDKVYGSEPPPKWVLAQWWLDARGVFFGLSTSITAPSPRATDGGGEAGGGKAGALARFMVDVLDYLRRDNLSALTKRAVESPREWQELAEQIARSHWHRRYVEIGLMDMAVRLVDPTRMKPRFKEIDPPPKPVMLQEQLKLKGEIGLIGFLRDIYRHGHPGDQYFIGIPPGFGIPVEAPQGNTDAEVRVIHPKSWPPSIGSASTPDPRG